MTKAELSNHFHRFRILKELSKSGSLKNVSFSQKAVVCLCHGHSYACMCGLCCSMSENISILLLEKKAVMKVREVLSLLNEPSSSLTTSGPLRRLKQINAADVSFALKPIPKLWPLLKALIKCGSLLRLPSLRMSLRFGN